MTNERNVSATGQMRKGQGYHACIIIIREKLLQIQEKVSC